MAFVSRTAMDVDAEDGCNDHLVCKARNGYRIYAEAGGYSHVSGNVTKKGKVVQGLEGRPLNFPTVESAMRWLKAGMPLCDARGNDLNPQTY